MKWKVVCLALLCQFDISLQVSNRTSHDVNRCEDARAARAMCTHHQNVTESDCLSLGCCWDPTHDELDNCYHMAVAQSRFKPNAYVGNEPFCVGVEETYMLADVNGDGNSDQLCRKSDEILIRTGTTYTEAKTFALHECSENNDEVITGDINGDGRSDIVCLTMNGGVMVWISKDGNTDFYDAEPWKDEFFGFCQNYTHLVKVSDFNGDGLDDLICAPETAAGKRSLAFGEKSGTFRAPQSDPNFKDFCTTARSKHFTGDFDSDGRTDLVCRVDRGKQYQIALTDGDGLLVNEDFTTVDSWCDKEADIFLVGDFNGDDHDDWICHHSDGSVCVKYNSHIFADADMFTQETCEKIDWCKDAADVMIGDHTGDGMDDLYCHGDDGNTSITTATVKAPLVDFVQTDWDSDVAWTETEKFCKDKELYVGDVNGDKRQDVVCHENKGGLTQRILGNDYGQLIYESKWTSFEDPDNVGRFCHRTHENPEYLKRYNGDANGDGKMDVLCHSQLTGNVDVISADEKGMFGASSLLKTAFCQGADATLSVADFDADGKVDLMCKTPTGTNIWLQDGRSVSADGWCEDQLDEVLVGQFIDGISDDLLCHNRKTGAKSILHVASTGGIKIEEIEGHKEWCLSEDQKLLKAGDFNGDKFTDLLCHKENGKIVVLLHQEEHKSNSGWFSEEFTAKAKFCLDPGSTLSVFDANGDGYDDLTCHTSTGRITISESHLVAEGKSEYDIDLGGYYNHFESDDGTVLYYRGITEAEEVDGSYESGKIGRAIDFGNYSWAILNGNFSSCFFVPMSCTEGFTVAFWIKIQKENLNNIGVISTMYEPYHTPGFQIYAKAGKKMVLRIKTGLLSNWCYIDMSLGFEWHHLTWVYDNSGEVRAYQSGRFNPSSAISVYRIDNNYAEKKVVLGQLYYNNTGTYEPFLLDELFMDDRVLTPEEIQGLYDTY